MFWIQLVVVTGVILVIAAVVLGAGGSLPDSHREQPELRMPEDRPLTSADIDHVRFPVVFRGYRMSEVDFVLDRLTGELAARDARILELEYKLAGTTPAGLAVAAPGGTAAVGATALGASRSTPPPRGSGTTLSLEKPESAESEQTITRTADRTADAAETADAPTVAEAPEPAEPTDVADAADAARDADAESDPKGDPKP
ncbi:DivIVA domain-containing protein [Embleya sp. NBC_00896]|uniref:DivIVA domain-containing protein n=1 Tax=Embleya sp. NBC_00896 TaxID=2975961 RepID=UPI00386E53F8|nr:DivIVA domain-containing protein [Embleya sp. NBC_00896]